MRIAGNRPGAGRKQSPENRDRQARALELQDQGMTLREIGEELRITKSAVGGLIHRAKEVRIER